MSMVNGGVSTSQYLDQIEDMGNNIKKYFLIAWYFMTFILQLGIESEGTLWHLWRDLPAVLWKRSVHVLTLQKELWDPWAAQRLQLYWRLHAQYVSEPFVFFIITVRNSSYGKVMFSQASVILSTGGSCTSPWQDTPSGRHPFYADTPPPCRHCPRQTPPSVDSPLDRHTSPLVRQPHPNPTPPDGHWSGRYASYWKAFLFSSNYMNSTE